MFEVAATKGDSPVKGPCGGYLHEHYAYVRLFLGRFLADVTAGREGDRWRFGWLVPDGASAPPRPERIRSELAGLGRGLCLAQAELRGGVGDGGVSLCRLTMARLTLAELRLPWSPQDIRFTRKGSLLMVNWCVESPQSGPRLADADVRETVDRLAGLLGVSGVAGMTGGR